MVKNLPGHLKEPKKESSKMRMRLSPSDKLVSKGLTERFVHEKQPRTFHLHNMSIFVHDESCMNALTDTKSNTMNILVRDEIEKPDF